MVCVVEIDILSLKMHVTIDDKSTPILGQHFSLD